MNDPYQNQLLNTTSPCHDHSPVIGRVVCVLNARANNRGLQLAPFPSRALLKNDIHELILTDETTAKPGQAVDQITYIAFFEIEVGGIIWADDQIQIDGKVFGILAGYDMTHMPNHMNIVIKTPDPLVTGYEAGIHVGSVVKITFPAR